MARDFPRTVTYAEAFDFALEAERACADMAAAAGVIAPDDDWREKLEELVCGHDDRVDKLERRRESGLPGERQAIDGSRYLTTLAAEPATAWPEAIHQLADAEDDAGRYHADFAAAYRDQLAGNARLFERAGAQAQTVAAELRAMLG